MDEKEFLEELEEIEELKLGGNLTLCLQLTLIFKYQGIDYKKLKQALIEKQKKVLEEKLGGMWKDA